MNGNQLPTKARRRGKKESRNTTDLNDEMRKDLYLRRRDVHEYAKGRVTLQEIENDEANYRRTRNR